MTVYENVNPLPVNERIATLDIVRGFALLGILIMNMPGFTNSFFVEADGSHLWRNPVDLGAELVRESLYFYSDPLMLWGTFGFYVQMTTTMLFGFLVGRHGWVRRIPELMPTIRRPLRRRSTNPAAIARRIERAAR